MAAKNKEMYVIINSVSYSNNWSHTNAYLQGAVGKVLLAYICNGKLMVSVAAGVAAYLSRFDYQICTGCDENGRVPTTIPKLGLTEVNTTIPKPPVEEPMPETDPKKARGDAKAPFHATPKLGYIQMSNVMAGGGWKYGDFNYTKTPVVDMTYISAIERHLLLWSDGTDTDKESGMSHLAHVMACCAILIEAEAAGKLVDNRHKTGLVEKYLNRSSKLFEKFKTNVKPKK